MEIVTVCRSCGRTIDKEFIYCPWCGVSALKPCGYAETFDEAFRQLELVQERSREERLDRMKISLDQLEQDLSILISRHGD